MLSAPSSRPPCILHEDEHLLVVNKPAGWNTHAPSPYAGEGIYDWLKHRERRWQHLAILHRLDKDTSGVIVFGKTPLANRSLTGQFAGRAVQKTYLLLTTHRPNPSPFVAKSKIIRAGDRYLSAPHGEEAITRFEFRGAKRLEHPYENSCEIVAEPLTGRTHQIRVHAAENGFPILGDSLYGGAAFPRLCLHATEIRFVHPATEQNVSFTAPVEFSADARLSLREAILDPSDTNACRLIHGASDGWPGWYVDRLGEFQLSQSERPLSESQIQFLRSRTPHPAPPLYHKTLSRQLRGSNTTEASPQLVSGTATPDRLVIRENGVMFELSFQEGYSVGLFLDQRDNRRRTLTRHVAAGFELFPLAEPGSSPPEVLNTFAYTCGFSVCAALAGARVTSLDLSRKYLEWGQRNFVLNELDPTAHDFIYGDTFDWLRRLARKNRSFDLVILDPPTFSQSKTSGVFRAGKDYGKLVAATLPVLKPGGVLLASTNAADFAPEKFLDQIRTALRSAERHLEAQHYAPQPPDFPISRSDPAYLKTVWMRIR